MLNLECFIFEYFSSFTSLSVQKLAFSTKELFCLHMVTLTLSVRGAIEHSSMFIIANETTAQNDQQIVNCIW